MTKKNNPDRKTVKVDFTNPEGRMKLTISSANSVDSAIKIMKTFDDACEEIRNNPEKFEVKENDGN